MSINVRLMHFVHFPDKFWWNTKVFHLYTRMLFKGWTSRHLWVPPLCPYGLWPMRWGGGGGVICSSDQQLSVHFYFPAMSKEFRSRLRHFIKNLHNICIWTSWNPCFTRMSTKLLSGKRFTFYLYDWVQCTYWYSIHTYETFLRYINYNVRVITWLQYFLIYNVFSETIFVIYANSNCRRTSYSTEGYI